MIIVEILSVQVSNDQDMLLDILSRKSVSE